MLQKLSDSLLRSIDLTTGEELPRRDNEIQSSINVIEIIADLLLGGKFIVKRTEFYISEVVIYYGGIGDIFHDWYRVKILRNHYGVSPENVQIFEESGLKVYFNFANLNYYNKHLLMDIVVGPENVPASILVNRVIDGNGNETTGPCLTLKALNVRNEDFGKIVKEDGDPFLDDFCIIFLSNTNLGKECSERGNYAKMVFENHPLISQTIDYKYGLKWKRSLTQEGKNDLINKRRI